MSEKIDSASQPEGSKPVKKSEGDSPQQQTALSPMSFIEAASQSPWPPAGGTLADLACY